MGNIYFDFRNNSPFTPFVGIGGGAVYYRERNDCGSPNTVKPGFQITTGINYRINKNLGLDIGYRYFRMQDAPITNKCLSPKIKYNTHEGITGLKIYF